MKLPYELAGSSTVVRECAAQLAWAAGDDRNVLIAAERGLDAGAVARAIHQGGPGKAGPFLVQTCAALSPAELERALFGSARRVIPNVADRTNLHWIGRVGSHGTPARAPPE